MAEDPAAAARNVAGWALALRPGDVPPEVRARARALLLDTLGVGIAAGRTPGAAVAYEFAAASLAPGHGATGVPLPLDGRPVSPAGCAYAFATRIDNLDAHDGYQPAKGHAGAAVAPALLATATPDTRGDEALAAVIAGYEVACRAAVALHATAGDYHSSGAWNALGAAVTAGRLRGLDAKRLATALGIAEYHAPRAPMMREIDAPSMLHDSSGWGSLAGVAAVDLAERGFGASPAALTARAGGWATLGRDWLTLEQYVKPHPVCFWTQPAVTAALALRADHRLAPARIASVRIETFHEATRLYAGVPADTQTAQYALAFPVAAALVHGRLGPGEITGAGLADPAAAELTDRVSVEECSAFNEAFPGRRLARVEVRLTDGEVLRSEPTEPRGTPASPLDEAALRAKFADYAGPVLGARTASALEAAVLALDGDEGSLPRLLEVLRGAT